MAGSLFAALVSSRWRGAGVCFRCFIGYVFASLAKQLPFEADKLLRSKGVDAVREFEYGRCLRSESLMKDGRGRTGLLSKAPIGVLTVVRARSLSLVLPVFPLPKFPLGNEEVAARDRASGLCSCLGKERSLKSTDELGKGSDNGDDVSSMVFSGDSLMVFSLKLGSTSVWSDAWKATSRASSESVPILSKSSYPPFELMFPFLCSSDASVGRDSLLFSFLRFDCSPCRLCTPLAEDSPALLGFIAARGIRPSPLFQAFPLFNLSSSDSS